MSDLVVADDSEEGGQEESNVEGGEPVLSLPFLKLAHGLIFGFTLNLRKVPKLKISPWAYFRKTPVRRVRNANAFVFVVWLLAVPYLCYFCTCSSA